MKLPPEADATRVLDDLLQIKQVMQHAEGDRFPDLEVSGHPQEVRPAPDGTPIFHFGTVAYCLRRDGSVSEVRRAGRGLIAYRRLNRRGETISSDLSLPGSDPEAILERTARRGDPALN